MVTSKVLITSAADDIFYIYIHVLFRDDLHEMPSLTFSEKSLIKKNIEYRYCLLQCCLVVLRVKKYVETIYRKSNVFTYEIIEDPDQLSLLCTIFTLKIQTA